MNAHRPHRPGGVTLLLVLLWLQALIGIAGGVILIIVHNSASVIRNAHQSASTLLAVGIATLIIGLITALIARGLGRGSNFARWIVGLISVLQLAGSIASLIRVHGESRIAAAVDGVIALIILFILFAERGSREYFGART
jgi:hypothetical protein